MKTLEIGLISWPFRPAGRVQHEVDLHEHSGRWKLPRQMLAVGPAQVARSVL
jgi:hypothetical protein